MTKDPLAPVFSQPPQRRLSAGPVRAAVAAFGLGALLLVGVAAAGRAAPSTPDTLSDETAARLLSVRTALAPAGDARTQLAATVPVRSAPSGAADAQTSPGQTVQAAQSERARADRRAQAPRPDTGERRVARRPDAIYEPGRRTAALALGRGDTLAQALRRSGVRGEDTYDVIRALTKTYDPRHLRPEHSIAMTLETVRYSAHMLLADWPPAQGPQDHWRAHDLPGRGVADLPADMIEEARLRTLTIRTDVDKEVAVSRLDSGEFHARQVVRELTEQPVHVRGMIESSLYMAAQNLGMPGSVIGNLANIYAYSINFQTEIRQGDTFEVLFTQYLDEDGAVVKGGDILYASMTNMGKTRELYRFQTPDDKRTDYYDPLGESVRKFLMRTPVDAARISSHFGRRFHPIKKRWRQHSGVDFAAPTGTRIYAAGDGTINFVGKAGGYGNLIKLTHSRGYETRYAHMSRFARGMRKGTRVRQGQLIGYVGSTGWSTGPHLHYEVRKNGKAVNPMSVRVPTGRALTGKTLTAFKDEKARIDAVKDAVPLISRTETAMLEN